MYGKKRDRRTGNCGWTWNKCGLCGTRFKDDAHEHNNKIKGKNHYCYSCAIDEGEIKEVD